MTLGEARAAYAAATEACRAHTRLGRPIPESTRMELEKADRDLCRVIRVEAMTPDELDAFMDDAARRVLGT